MTDPLPLLITKESANDKSLHGSQVGITQGLETKHPFSIFITLALLAYFCGDCRKGNGIDYYACCSEINQVFQDRLHRFIWGSFD